MYKATISVGISLVKHYNKYEHSVAQEIFYKDEEEYDQKVKYWQAKVRKLVMEEMAKDEVKKK